MRIKSLVATAVLVLTACVARPRQAADERASSATMDLRVVDPLAIADDRQACGDCHPEITAEWSASQHRSAWSDVVFQAGYAVDREPECRHCHAPLAPRGEDPHPSTVAARNGISCRSCHAQAGAIAGPPGRRAHAGPVDRTWSSAAACDGCHEFDFPPATEHRNAVFDPRDPMQRTMTEWQQARTTQTCQDCHMPWRIDARGHRYRSHRVLGIDDPELMARAVRVELRLGEPPLGGERPLGAPDEVLIEVEVHADAIAHAFPTGDMFRLAELRIHPEGQPELAQRVVMRRELGRVLRPDEHGRMRAFAAEVADTRPHPGKPLRRRLRFAGQPTALVWTLVHLRMPLEQAQRQGLPPSLVTRAIAEGRTSLAITMTPPVDHAPAVVRSMR